MLVPKIRTHTPCHKDEGQVNALDKGHEHSLPLTYAIAISSIAVSEAFSDTVLF